MASTSPATIASAAASARGVPLDADPSGKAPGAKASWVVPVLTPYPEVVDSQQIKIGALHPCGHFVAFDECRPG